MLGKSLEVSSQHLVDRTLHAFHLDDELGDLVVALLDERHRLPLGVPGEG